LLSLSKTKIVSHHGCSQTSSPSTGLSRGMATLPTKSIHHHRRSTPGIPALLYARGVDQSTYFIQSFNPFNQSMHSCATAIHLALRYSLKTIIKTIARSWCCHGIMVRRTVACKRSSWWLSWLTLAMPVLPSPVFHGSWSVHCNGISCPSSSSNCSS
jgi:hypothetical protein